MAAVSKPDSKPSNPRSGASRSTDSKPKPSVETPKPEPANTPNPEPITTPPLNTNDTVAHERPEGEATANGNDLVTGLNDWGGADPPPQLDLAEGELLSQGRGSRGDDVTMVQEMLNAQGSDIKVDGIFGPETAGAIEAFQREHDLKIDGIVGPETQGALNRLAAENGLDAPDPQSPDPQSPETPDPESPQSPDPENPEVPNPQDPETPDPEGPREPGQRGEVDLADPTMTEAERYDHYRELIEANGGRINPDGPTVLGLRGMAVDGERNGSWNNHGGGYDDTFVVLNTGPNGEPSVELFEGTTHANATYSPDSYGPDANGNRINGVAMLAPGSYEVVPHSNNYQGRWGQSYHVRTQDGSGYVPAYRDTDSNGVISPTEVSQAVNGGYQATDILFHSGKRDSPSTIGCQTIEPGQLADFAAAIGNGGFEYTLIDANDAVMPW